MLAGVALLGTLVVAATWRWRTGHASSSEGVAAHSAVPLASAAPLATVATVATAATVAAPPTTVSTEPVATPRAIVAKPAPARPRAGANVEDDECDIPFTVDGHGARTYKRGCLGAP